MKKIIKWRNAFVVVDTVYEYTVTPAENCLKILWRDSTIATIAVENQYHEYITMVIEGFLLNNDEMLDLTKSVAPLSKSPETPVKYELKNYPYMEEESAYAEPPNTIKCETLLVTLNGEPVNYICDTGAEESQDAGICVCHHHAVLETIFQFDKTYAPVVVFIGSFSLVRMKEIKAICESYFVKSDEDNEVTVSGCTNTTDTISEAQKYIADTTFNLRLMATQQRLRLSIENMVDAIGDLDKMRKGN